MWQDHHIVTTDGVRLHVEQTARTGPSVLMLHGITNSGRMWRRVGEALAPDYHIVTYDARGHGQSYAPAEGYDPQSLATDALEVIQQLALEDVILIGHSMGAHTAALFAVTHPQRVKQVILEDPPWKAAPASDAERLQTVARWRQLCQQRKKQTIAQLIGQIRQNSPHWLEDEYEIWAGAKHAFDERACAFLGYLLGWRAIIADLTMPTLLCAGDPDAGSMLEASVLKTIDAGYALIQVEQFQGVGHNISRDAYPQFIDVITRFLRT